MSVETDRILKRLSTVLDPVDAPMEARPTRGDGDLNEDLALPVGRKLKPAAVLALLVKRETGLTVLFTRRADHLQAHPGQVSFPGGRQMAGRESLC